MRTDPNPPKPVPVAVPAVAEPKRFGPYAIVREGPETEDGHLLGQFAERRREPRYPALEHHVWVGWWLDPGRFHSVPAHLDNISQGGARVLLADPPEKDRIVWLCLGEPDPLECVRAKVLDVAPGRSGEAVIRLAFGTPCPANFYRIAVLGRGT